MAPIAAYCTIAPPGHQCVPAGFFVTHPTLCPFHCSALCCRGIFWNPGFLLIWWRAPSTCLSQAVGNYTTVQGLLLMSRVQRPLRVSWVPNRGSQTTCRDAMWVSYNFNGMGLDWPFVQNNFASFSTMQSFSRVGLGTEISVLCLGTEIPLFVSTRGRFDFHQLTVMQYLFHLKSGQKGLDDTFDICDVNKQLPSQTRRKDLIACPTPPFHRSDVDL